MYIIQIKDKTLSYIKTNVHYTKFTIIMSFLSLYNIKLLFRNT